MLSSVPNQPGLWPDLRRDARLSGMQPLAGRIRRPRIRARHYLGGAVFDAHIIDGPGGGRCVLMLDGGRLVLYAANGARVWASEPFGAEGVIGIADVDNDGTIEIVSSNGKSLFVHCARTGRRLWHEYLGPPVAGGFIFTCALLHHFPQVGAGMQLAVGLLSSKEVVVYDFTPGASSPERLHLLWMDDFFHPTVLAADVDGDGAEELIVTKYSAVYVFDPLTGALKSECRWSSGGTPKRNYGLFEARDLNADGAPDIAILSYVVSRHFAVVENSGGALANRWDRFIEHVYPNDEREIRYTFNSIADIDGDGRLEAVVSVYNEHDDGRWWLEVIDIWSGETRLRLADLYLHGVQPAGDGGAPVLLVSAERSRYPATTSRVAMLGWRDGGLEELWSMEDAAFAGRFVRPSATRTVFKTEPPPIDEVWYAAVDGADGFVLKHADESIALLVRDGGSWSVRPVPGTAGTAAVVAVDDLGAGPTKILLSDYAGAVRAVGADGGEHMRVQAGMRLRQGASLYFVPKPPPVPTVAASAAGRFCIVPDCGVRVHCLRWDSAHDSFATAWAIEGRGRVGPEESRHVVPVVMLDDAPAVLLAEITDGPAALRAVGLDGVERRRWNVPAIPGSPRVPRGRAGIHEVTIVPAERGPLLAVSGFRSGSMNSELTTVLDAASGEEQWRHVVVAPETEDGRGFGPWSHFSVVGTRERPELLFLAKDTMMQVDALNGELLHRPWHLRPHNTRDLLRRGMTMDDFTAYGTPVAADCDGDGVDEWLLMANYGGLGLFRPDHSVVWWRSAPLSSLTSGFGGLADIDNDGVMEIGLSYADGSFVCLNAATGEERWRLHLGEVASDVACCDIDGDGRVEFVLGTREGSLMAVGVSRDGAGLVKWRMQFDSSLGSPICADIDGDGFSEVLVVAGDGALYVIGESQQREGR